MKSNFRTKDLSEASLLYASGKKLQHPQHENGKVWFVFEDKASCEEIVHTYWRREAVINAKDYADAIRTLKDLIFNK